MKDQMKEGFMKKISNQRKLMFRHNLKQGLKVGRATFAGLDEENKDVYRD